MAIEEGAGVLEVLFGVGFGGGDTVKRFVEDADDPPLFGERRKRERESENCIDIARRLSCARKVASISATVASRRNQ